MATNINNKLVCNEPHASLDSYYGPYGSVHEAFLALADTTVNGVTYTKKHIGLTVGVWTNSSHTEITEYWFKGGLGENNLVVKQSDSGGGLPSGMKIVTFDKNGGNGVQNPIITDTSSQVVLPACTLTKSGTSFSKWKYGNNQYNPSDVITVGTSTVVQAIWGSSPTQNYTVSWYNGTNITITGKVGSTTISPGASVAKGTSVILTATPTKGYQLKNWVNKPTGAIEGDGTLTFTVNNNVSGVSAVAEEIPVQKITITVVANPSNGGTVTGGGQYNSGAIATLTATEKEGYRFVSWSDGGNKTHNVTVTKEATYTANFELIPVTTQYMVEFTYEGEGINGVSGKDSKGEAINSGEYYDEGTEITLTAELDDGYVADWGKELPKDAVISGNELSFTLTDNVSIKVTATKQSDNGFYYYGCNSSESESVYFDKPEDLIYVNDIISEHIDNNKAEYDILYVIRGSNVAPKCITPDKSIEFYPLNDCPDDRESMIYKHFVDESLVVSGTNEVNGDSNLGKFIKDKGYIFILIDTKKVLNRISFRISLY